jgi:hypothetical protein
MAGEDTEKKNRPDDSDFKQQRLKAWQPILTPAWVIITFAAVGVVFMIIGILVLVASNQVVEYTSGEYQNCNDVGTSSCTVGNGSTSTSCLQSISITIDDDMDQPVYVYYQLSNFYQNHRRYVKSRSDTQLRNSDKFETDGCDPLATRTCPGGSGDCGVYPCGLIAWSVFNDTFYNNVKDLTTTADQMAAETTVAYYPANGGNISQDLAWTNESIAWASDKEKKFIRLSQSDALAASVGSRSNPSTCGSGSCLAMPYDSYKYWLCAEGDMKNTTCPSTKRYADVHNEEFIVWMRTSGLPEFRKLHRIIKQDLKKGDRIEIKVNNVFPVCAFDGTKKIVLSTTTWIGGKNQFLGYAYIVVASLCILLAIGFGIKQVVSPRKLAQSSGLKESLGDNEGTD